MKLALVTGGQRRLGAAIAARLGADGWTLALHSHAPADDGSQLPNSHSFVTELNDPTATDALIGQVSAHFGTTPSLLVNNAARFEWDDAATITSESLSAHHAVNAAAPVILALALARAGGTGNIINILDQRIANPNGDQLAYTLSKTALAGATRTLAAALAPHWRVNAIAPGLTIPTAEYSPEQMERLAHAMPLGRLPAPSDIADAVAFLAAAPAITGQTLFVDGGASLRSFDRDFVFL